jgi:hypothetical protein
MTFAAWDIVEIFTPQTGYDKYYVCVVDASSAETGKFLFMNSENNWASDFVLKCADVPCLPRSKT